ncbi:hypothetical protein K2X85_19565 [bacterium]|nr:hypothetical protein [bacterium]
MGRRVAAAWALIGFACQCFLGLLHHPDLVTGLQNAMIHYLAWGLTGYFVGTIAERFIEEAFRQRYQAVDSEDVQPTMTDTSDRTTDEPASADPASP